MMGEMTGTIRGTMGDFIGENMGGNFRGQTRMDTGAGRMRAANMGAEPGQSFGVTFSSGGGDLSYPASGGPRYSKTMMEGEEEEDYRPRMTISSSGDRDLRSSARNQFQSSSGHFVIGGGQTSSSPLQSDSFSRGKFERQNRSSQGPSIGTIGGSSTRGGRQVFTTWSN